MKTQFFLAIASLFLYFSWSLATESENTITLNVDHDEVLSHVRRDDASEHAFERAAMRYANHILKDRDASAALEARGAPTSEGHDNVTEADPGTSNIEVLAFYKPNFEAICRANHFPVLSTNDRLCISQVDFLVECNEGEGDYDVSVRSRCRREFFCSTVYRGTYVIIDPDNAAANRDLDVICVRRIVFSVYRLRTALNELISLWVDAPLDRRVMFGRIQLSGDTTGVPVRLNFYKRPPASNLRDNLGTKNIESTNHGREHEYELSYNYEKAKIQIAAGVSTGPRNNPLRMDLYLSFFSP